MSEAATLFAHHGYAVLPDFFQLDEIAEVSSEVDRVISGAADYMPAGDLMYEPGSNPPQVRNAFRLHRHHPIFMDMARNSKLVALVSEILGSPLRLYGCQLFAKPAMVGTQVPLHQDFPYWPFAVPELLSCWIPLDDSNIENGCVRFVTGSHQLGLLNHVPSGVPGNSLTIDDSRLVGLEEIPVEVTPGACVLHHCLTAHRSEPNRSPHRRRGLILVYMSPKVLLKKDKQVANDFPTVTC